MGNISNFNVNRIDMRLSNYDYWDLYLADGDFNPRQYGDTIISGDCLVAHYDFNNINIYPDGTQYVDEYGPQYGTIVGEYGESQYTYQYAPQYGSVVGQVNSICSLTTWADAFNTGYTIPTIGS